MERLRRAVALRSYRSILISSGNARLTDSAVRTKSPRVARPLMGGWKDSSRSSASKEVEARFVDSVAASATSANVCACSIKMILVARICASSSSARAALRAYSSVTESVALPAISNANLSTRSLSCTSAVLPAARPCRYELRHVRRLPPLDRGPVLLRALRRLAAICRSVTMRLSRGRRLFRRMLECHDLTVDEPVAGFAESSCQVTAPTDYATERLIAP
jgi:hypothetical protein